ncbi:MULTISPECIES: hypothetical protein [Priestia]|uniref:hypothetical protein n=1 Tax=Priestia TaxID=2800373 RepID=UPI0011B7F915|nr:MULTISPECIES: hypothetical protein [Priestia]MCG0050151.1 hypothetical protein [Priestia aryabhattai]QDZ88175.1 hypothetical protein D0441_28245 [Priestia megaterium]
MPDQNWKRSSPAYGNVTLIGSKPIMVNSGESITFNQNGPLNHIKFILPSDTLIIGKSGDYKIEYVLLIDGPSSSSTYGLILNNVLVKDKLTNYGIQRQVNGASLMLIGQAIIHIPKHSTLELRNIGPSTDTLLPIIGEQEINAASLTIVKLN